MKNGQARRRFCGNCGDLLLTAEHWLCTACAYDQGLPMPTDAPVPEAVRAYRLACLACGADRWLQMTRTRARLYVQVGFSPCPTCRGPLDLAEDLHTNSSGPRRLLLAIDTARLAE